MYKLLIADDEVLEREAIQYIVRENFGEEFEIRQAGNGREAIEQAETFKPDLIFFDIKMPGINGLEAAAQIRAAHPECRFVILSAYQYFHYAQDAVTLKANEYITKPAPAATIVAVVKKVLAEIDQDRFQRKQAMETALKLQQVTQYLKEELLILIALGEVEERVIQEYFTVLNLNCRSFIFVILSICNDAVTESLSEIDRAIRKKQVVEKLQVSLESQGCDALIGTMGQEIYLLLLVNQDFDEYESRVFGVNLLSRIKEQVLSELQVSMNVGIGNSCSQVGEIYTSFLQAKNSLRYDTTPGTLVSYGDIIKVNQRTAYPFNKERLLYESIIQGNDKSAIQLLDEILDWMSINIANPEHCKQKVFELLLVLVRETIMNTNLAEFSLDTEELRHAVFLLDNNREIRTYAKQFINSKIAEINNIKSSRANALLDRVVDYLERNYTREISLEDVAEIIQISPFYLSKLFKKELGENFIDYLTGIRIKKAKEILADPLSSVKDACYQVGYHDPNYFARVFKKSCGVTPSEYKASKILHAKN